MQAQSAPLEDTVKLQATASQRDSKYAATTTAAAAPIKEAVEQEELAEPSVEEMSLPNVDQINSVSKLHELLQSFDRLALVVDPRTGKETYEAWALPMAKKLHEKIRFFEVESQRKRLAELEAAEADRVGGDYDESEVSWETASSAGQSTTASQASNRSDINKHEWYVHINDDLPFLYDAPKRRKVKRLKGRKKKTSSSSSSRRSGSRQQQQSLPSELKSLIYQLWEANELESKKKKANGKRKGKGGKKGLSKSAQQIAKLEQEMARMSELLASGKSLGGEHDDEADAKTREKTRQLIELMQGLQKRHDTQNGRLDQLKAKQAEMADRHLQLSMDSAASSGNKSALMGERENMHREWIKRRMRADEKRNQLDDLMKLVKDNEMKKKVYLKQIQMLNAKLGNNPDHMSKEDKKIQALKELLASHLAKKQEAEQKLTKTEVELLALQDKERHLMNQISREKDQNKTYCEQLDRMRDVIDVVLDEDDSKRKKIERQISTLHKKLHHSHRYKLNPAQKLRSMVHKYMTHIYRKACEEHYHHVGILEAKAAAELDRVKDGFGMQAQLQGGWEKDTRDHLLQMLRSRQDLFLDLKTSYLKQKKELTANEARADANKQAVADTERQIESLRNKIKKQTQPEEEIKTFQNFMMDAFRGDYLEIKQSGPALANIYQGGDSEIIFSDLVVKVNRRDRSQKRGLVVTEKSIVTMLPHKPWTVKRRINISDLIFVSLSSDNSELLILHHQHEHDYLIFTPKRSEMVFRLMQGFVKLTGHPLKCVVDEKLYVGDKGLVNRQVNVLDSKTVQYTRQRDPSRVPQAHDARIVTKVIRNIPH